MPRWAVAAACAGGLGFGLMLHGCSGSDAAPPGASPVALTQTVSDAAPDAVQQALRAGKPTLVEFGANACAACREMKPVLEAVRRDHGTRFAVVDVDLIKHKEIGYIQRYRIQLMPTQVFFDAQGRETSRNIGKLSAEEILAGLQAGHP